MTCTWVGCTRIAKFPQTTKDGEVWANLCAEHAKELESGLTATAPIILRNWVRAGGGAEKMAARMARDI